MTDRVILKRATPGVSRPTQGTFYERLGGEPGLQKIIDDFVERIFGDIMIGFFFREASKPRIKRFEFQHASELLGGPDRYEGKPLKDAHERHPILGAHFARRLQILRQVFAAHAVPQDIQDAWLAHNLALRDQVTAQTSGECRD